MYPPHLYRFWALLTQVVAGQSALCIAFPMASLPSSFFSLLPRILCVHEGVGWLLRALSTLLPKVLLSDFTRVVAPELTPLPANAQPLLGQYVTGKSSGCFIAI